VLSDLELVQIYDRPMKISLTTPILPIWQKLINKRIEELQNEFQLKKQKLEETLQLFLGTYGIKEEISQEPIEFISFSKVTIDDIYYHFLARSRCKIAIGFRYENPLIYLIQEKNIEEFPESLKENLVEGINKIKNNLKKVNIQAIFNKEVLTEILQSRTFITLSRFIEFQNFEINKIDVHVTEANFSNFSLTDNELLQPSFDPSNKLMGSYISRNESIYQIFNDKFNEIFENGIPLNLFLNEFEDSPYESLSEIQTFTLCLL
jgi:hypothetical protein